MAGLGQYGADQLTWSTQYNLQGRKPTVAELSPGARKTMGVLGMGQKPKKGFFADEDDLDSSNPDIFLSQSLFAKDAFSTSSLYSQSSGGSLGVLGDDGLSGLGLQQPQRGLGSQHLSRGFGSNSISGHITPTSTGMHNFPSSLSGGLPQQPSPNRNLLSMSSRGILGQVNRDMKRPVAGNIGMPGFGIMHHRGFSHGMLSGGLQSMTGSFSSNSINDTPAALDLSEFPSLTNRGRQESSGGVPMNAMMGRTAYVGMVKQPASESTEFQIHSEDFPALPGSQVQETPITDSSMKGSTTTIVSDAKDSGRFPGDKNSSQVQKRGIQTSPDGKVTNIPGGMVTDQFGLVGLLTFIRAAETDQNLVALALGSDLTTLGLNLNSSESLHPNFGGPYAESPCRPQDIDFHVPIEYLTNMSIRDKLAPVKLNRYTEDLLFYMFYTNGGDVLQLAAAAELYNREWRYHKEERVWVTRAPGMAPTEKTNTYERGMYYYFDAEKWRKVAKEFHLDYDKLEERPHLPPSLQHCNPPLAVLS